MRVDAAKKLVKNMEWLKREKPKQIIVAIPIKPKNTIYKLNETVNIVLDLPLTLMWLENFMESLNKLMISKHKKL
ncbi:hypothetical protein YTPLAS73_04390 [Nitrosarchaeum sp.]|nr:hypothetical protein YTPLAS73_04390 [Nitrosarchaeum sp.]